MRFTITTLSLLLILFSTFEGAAQVANEDCVNAIVITPSVTPNCTYTTGTFSGSAQGTIPCMSGNHQDVWYQFVATEEVMRVSIPNTSFLNVGFEIIDGSCAGASVTCVNNNGTNYGESYTGDQFVIGTTYFIRVYNAGTNLSTIDFNICVQSYPPPANEDCSDAITLTPSISPNCAYTTGSFSGSSYSTIPCMSGNHQDIWYQFVATEEVMRVSIPNTSFLNVGFEIIDGSCAGASVTCVNNNGTNYGESYTGDQFIIGNTYFIRVYNVGTNLSTIDFNICVQSYPPPTNEDCSDAITLTPSISPNCSYTTGSFSGSSYSTIPCMSGNHQDVWYQFVATEEVMRVSIPNTSFLNVGFEIIDGSCAGASVTCVNNNGTNYGESYTGDQFVIGTTYFIRVYNAGTNLSTIDFNICVQSYPPPTNEDCSDAITLTPSISPNCAYTTGSFSGSSYSTIPCMSGNHQDVWYQFTATATTHKVSLSAQSGLNHGFEVIDGSCAGTSLTCVNNNGTNFGESYVDDQFVVGNTYFVRVFNVGTNLSSGDFDICIESFAPPANEHCSNAETLTPSISPNCSFTTGSFYGSVRNTITCETGDHQDVWYQFVATSATHKISLTAESGLNHGFEVIDGSCMGASLLCVDNSGTSFSETNTSGFYVIGNTYFVRVYNSNSSLAALDFGICIESFPISPNDDCSDAITLTPSVSPNCNYVTGSFSGAALGTIPCESGTHQDVWYQFTATSPVHKISLAAESGVNHGLEVIDGSCTGSSIACVNNNGASFSESYTAGTYIVGSTYFVRVYNVSTAISSSDFDICVESFPPPANDDCADAIALTAEQTCTYTAGSFSGSGQNSQACEAGLHQDVWYSFVATNNTMYVGLEASNDLDHGFEVLDACGGTSLNCTNANGVSSLELQEVTNLTIGNTYYVRVYNANTDLSAQPFGICVYGEDQNSSVDDQEDLMQLSIYPNPSEDGVFYLSNAENLEEITIYDVSLKQVERKVHDVEMIDLSEHSSGVYFVKCSSTGGGNEVIRKVVKR